jgi:hypothetical protein
MDRRLPLRSAKTVATQTIPHQHRKQADEGRDLDEDLSSIE